MTNPVDETNELDNVGDAEELSSDVDGGLSVEDEIPLEEETKPAVKKKILALEARHKIEDYELDKQMREALDYFDEGEEGEIKKKIRTNLALAAQKKKTKTKRKKK